MPLPHVGTWFKSSYSGANTTECVECALTTTGALVRDSKRPDGPVITLRASVWQSFVAGVRADDVLDLAAIRRNARWQDA